MFDDGFHEVNLAIVQSECGKEEKIFNGENSVEIFLTWIANYKTNSKRIFICHNFGHFDGYPILHFFYSKSIKVNILLFV